MCAKCPPFTEQKGNSCLVADKMVTSDRVKYSPYKLSPGFICGKDWRKKSHICAGEGILGPIMSSKDDEKTEKDNSALIDDQYFFTSHRNFTSHRTNDFKPAEKEIGHVFALLLPLNSGRRLNQEAMKHHESTEKFFSKVNGAPVLKNLGTRVLSVTEPESKSGFTVQYTGGDHCSDTEFYSSEIRFRCPLFSETNIHRGQVTLVQAGCHVVLEWVTPQACS